MIIYPSQSLLNHWITANMKDMNLFRKYRFAWHDVPSKKPDTRCEESNDLRGAWGCPSTSVVNRSSTIWTSFPTCRRSVTGFLAVIWIRSIMLKGFQGSDMSLVEFTLSNVWPIQLPLFLVCDYVASGLIRNQGQSHLQNWYRWRSISWIAAGETNLG